MRAFRVLVFARDPLPGRTKTRLIPALGAEGARDCYLALLDLTLERARDAAIGAVELWSDAAPTVPALQRRAETLGTPLRVQPEGDLGARMQGALEVTLAAGDCPILIGSDVAGLTVGHLRGAAAALADGADAVFAPALDGGYGLIGLVRAWPEVLAAMPWGSAEVMAHTRARFGARRVVELEPVWDIDEPADLARLAQVPGLEQFAPVASGAR